MLIMPLDALNDLFDIRRGAGGGEIMTGRIRSIDVNFIGILAFG